MHDHRSAAAVLDTYREQTIGPFRAVAERRWAHLLPMHDPARRRTMWYGRVYLGDTLIWHSGPGWESSSRAADAAGSVAQTLLERGPHTPDAASAILDEFSADVAEQYGWGRIHPNVFLSVLCRMAGRPVPSHAEDELPPHP